VIRFPTGPNAPADLVTLFREGLRASKVEAGETVVVYADTLTNPNYPAAFLAAAKDLGAEALQVVQPLVPHEPGPGTGRAQPSKLIKRVMTGANLVVDVSTAGMLYSSDQAEILASGTRILRVREPDDCLLRLFPDAAVRDRTLRGGERLAAARRLCVATGTGADLRMEKAERRVHLQYGMADRPGRWDHWPTGMVSTTAVEETVEGTLVVGPASIVFPLERYVSEPITMRFERGVAVAIEGGADAIMMREFLARGGETNRRLAHIGWGTDHRARWDILGSRGADGGGGAEARSIYGGVLLALGENRDLGGSNAASIHMDIALRHARLDLDGTPVVDSGRILEPSIA
jgi:2,5-dihydroxypyridine 5,6-dioxygenase